LRSIPSKLGGILFMFGSIFILFFLPVLFSPINLSQTTGKFPFFFTSKVFAEEGLYYDLFFVI